MSNKLWTGFIGASFFSLLVSTSALALTPFEQLGKDIYFDNNLSDPDGQSCSSCHLPSAGFADPDQNIPVSEGVIPGRFGGRNAPSASYAVFFPEFLLKGKTNATGGQFWDGRALNLTEQAKGPFLNPVEMNNLKPGEEPVEGKTRVILDIVNNPNYGNAFVQECGAVDFGSTVSICDAYDCMASAIAAFESTSELSPFSSKFDAVQAGLATFTDQEAQGFSLFRGRGKCSNCHSTKRLNDEPEPIFTDFQYHNIGLPHNPEIDVLLGSVQPPDLGIGGRADVLEPALNGKFKTNHLRNVEHTAPYMHNGVLKTLKEVVNFYNTRDIPGMWPPAEVPDNLDSQFLGNLGLTDVEEDAIVAFMLTLSDGFFTP